MDELTHIEVVAEPIDDVTSRLTVTGQTEIIALLMLLIVSAIGDEEDDCGDPDCPVHGDGAESDVDVEAA